MAKFKIQKTSSTINWTGKKVLGLHTGTIGIANGFIDLEEGKINGGEVAIDMASIVITDIEDPKTNQDFKDHLFHDDFFGVTDFPTSHLLIHPGADPHNLSGVLTIKGTAHPVNFKAKTEVFTDTLHSLGEIVIDRTLYNIRYGSGKFIPNLGDKLIHDDFVLQFKIVAQKES